MMIETFRGNGAAIAVFGAMAAACRGSTESDACPSRYVWELIDAGSELPRDRGTPMQARPTTAVAMFAPWPLRRRTPGTAAALADRIRT
jgi:hypothetical protein